MTTGFDPNAGKTSGIITSSTPSPLVGPIPVGTQRPTASAAITKATESDLIREYGRKSDAQRKALAAKLKAAGYKVPVTGAYDSKVRDAFIDANTALSDEIATLQQSDPSRLAEISYDLDSYLDDIAAQKAATGGGKTYEPYGQQTVYTPTKAKDFVTDQFKSILNREPSAKELSTWSNKLIKEQQKASSTAITKYKMINGIRTAVSTTGLDEAQWLSEQLASDKTLGAEISKLETTDPDVIRREKDKAVFDKAIAAAGGDIKKIAQIEKTTSYGKDLANLRNKINTYILKTGAAPIESAELDAIAKEALDTAIDKDANTLNTFIDSKLKFGIGEGGIPKGIAGENYNDLAKVAAANGLDLQKAFGAQLPDWLAKINAGESIETYKRAIRDVAKIGMPEKISKLIDQGIDLSTIYSPYKNLMASTLEISPESIDLKDPTLRAAITADKEVPLYEFERALRKDNRWQYTNQAKEEVSNATRKILQDFGFMG